MRLWTIQPIEVYEILKEKGVFTCEEEKSELFKDFKNSYGSNCNDFTWINNFSSY